METSSSNLNQELNGLQAIIGISQEASKMRVFAKKAAHSHHTILLLGETGVGKDHLAEYIHGLGGIERPFVPVDCGTLPDNLVESELFGYTKGAFTGAVASKTGLVQTAEGGTLFLNEVANMPFHVQAKLLRCVEGRSFRQVGGTHEIDVNTRLIIGTNVNLEQEVAEKRMRADLYFRLNSIVYKMAPLRERKEDIPALTTHFLDREESVKKFSPDALAVMMDYHWPGNVRELRNAVVRGLFHSVYDREIGVDHVKPYLATPNSTSIPMGEKWVTLREMERAYISKVLAKTGGNVAQAAKTLGLVKTTLIKKIQRDAELENLVATLKKI